MSSSVNNIRRICNAVNQLNVLIVKKFIAVEVIIIIIIKECKDSAILHHVDLTTLLNKNHNTINSDKKFLP